MSVSWLQGSVLLKFVDALVSIGLPTKKMQIPLAKPLRFQITIFEGEVSGIFIIKELPK